MWGSTENPKLSSSQDSLKKQKVIYFMNCTLHDSAKYCLVRGLPVAREEPGIFFILAY